MPAGLLSDPQLSKSLARTLLEDQSVRQDIRDVIDALLRRVSMFETIYEEQMLNLNVYTKNMQYITELQSEITALKFKLIQYEQRNLRHKSHNKKPAFNESEIHSDTSEKKTVWRRIKHSNFLNSVGNIPKLEYFRNYSKRRDSSDLSSKN